MALAPKMELSKQDKREARRLVALAYERELGALLGELEQQFVAWRSGQLSVHDLAQAVHEFHDGSGRDLYKIYVMSDACSSLSQAIARQILKEDEVSISLLDRFQATIEFFATDFGEDDAPEPGVSTGE